MKYKNILIFTLTVLASGYVHAAEQGQSSASQDAHLSAFETALQGLSELDKQLFRAVYNGSTEGVISALSAGANVNKQIFPKNNFGTDLYVESPLTLAAKKGLDDIVPLLLAAGATDNYFCRGVVGSQLGPMSDAERKKKIACIHYILSNWSPQFSYYERGIQQCLIDRFPHSLKFLTIMALKKDVLSPLSWLRQKKLLSIPSNLPEPLPAYYRGGFLTEVAPHVHSAYSLYCAQSAVQSIQGNIYRLQHELQAAQASLPQAQVSYEQYKRRIIEARQTSKAGDNEHKRRRFTDNQQTSGDEEIHEA